MNQSRTDEEDTFQAMSAVAREFRTVMLKQSADLKAVMGGAAEVLSC